MTNYFITGAIPSGNNSYVDISFHSTMRRLANRRSFDKYELHRFPIVAFIFK